MTPAAPTIILSDFRCRHCRRAIPLSFTAPMPWLKRENGVLCENCIVREQENLRRLQAGLNDFNASPRYLDIEGIAPPCAVCDTVEGDTRVLEDYEGSKAFMCKPCADAYLVANRDKIRDTSLEWSLKLR